MHYKCWESISFQCVWWGDLSLLNAYEKTQEECAPSAGQAGWVGVLQFHSAGMAWCAGWGSLRDGPQACGGRSPDSEWATSSTDPTLLFNLLRAGAMPTAWGIAFHAPRTSLNPTTSNSIFRLCSSSMAVRYDGHHHGPTSLLSPRTISFADPWELNDQPGTI